VKNAAKKLFYISAFEENKTNQTKTWKLIRELVTVSKVKENRHRIR